MSGERSSPEWGEVTPVLFGRTGPLWCVVGLLAVCAPEQYGGGEVGVLDLLWIYVLGRLHESDAEIKRKKKNAGKKI